MVEDLRNPNADPMLGRCIDRFVLVAKLGEGGMGKVYLAEHQGSAHSRCVIKLMLEQYAGNEQMLKRFEAEAEATSRLKHDNIVRLENFGVLEDGIMFLRFEYLEGETLEQHLTNHGGKLPLHEAFHLLAQALDALDHAHANGVVHRDLKPENMFVVNHPRIGQLLKVLDFGICKDLNNEERKTHTGVAMGTPYYMALEQYVHAAGADHFADTWAMGIIAWEMLTGRLPWGKPDIAVLYHEQLTKIPARPPVDDMPFDVATVLLRCFAVTPSDRPTMRELAVSIASAIPAEGHSPSGAAILAPLAPRWIVASPSNAETMPMATARARPRALASELMTGPMDPAWGPPSGGKPASGIPRWMLASLGVAVSVVAAVVCFAIVRLHEGAMTDVAAEAASPEIASRSHAGIEVAPPTDAGPPSAIAPHGVTTTDPQAAGQTRSHVATMEPQPITSARPSKRSAPAAPKSNASSAAATGATAAGATAAGELVVSIDPYAEVWLDNQAIGSTPIKLWVRVGTHRLWLVNKDLSVEKSLNVTISAGKQSRVEESW